MASPRFASCRRELVVLGLVTSKRGELEDKDKLKRRIDEATKLRRRSISCASRRSAGGARSEATEKILDFRLPVLA